MTADNLAFCGRLVPQCASEGIGHVLLQRINASLPKNLKVAGNRKKGQEAIDPMTCPPDLAVPVTWAWSYLTFMCEQIADVDHNMPKAVQDGVPFISAKDLKDDGTIDFSAPKMISEADYTRMS
jgi:type I restriction enzyme, S subunit